jgi:hypothetical protein
MPRQPTGWAAAGRLFLGDPHWTEGNALHEDTLVTLCKLAVNRKNGAGRCDPMTSSWVSLTALAHPPQVMAATEKATTVSLKDAPVSDGSWKPEPTNMV